MANGANNVTIEGFVTDLAFVDQTKNTLNMFPENAANVGELSANALSYFDNPTIITDRRAPGERDINWAAQTNSKIVIDEAVFPSFVGVIKTSTTQTLNQFFAIIDKLLFNFKANVPKADVETFLTTNALTKAIYVPKSFTTSTLLVTDTVYLDGNNTRNITVPSYVNLEVKIPTGSTTVSFILKLYTSLDAWLKGYSRSIIAQVVPPLPYTSLYNASLGTATDNIFSTASITAGLSYNTLEARLRNMTVSGMVEYRVVLKDTINSVPVPFNILYKGRTPSLFDIRNAIKDQLLSSGVGDEAGWRKRIPGVFVEGRFYIVPLWDKTYQKPDQLVYPNILNFNDTAATLDTVLSSLGYSDVTEYMDIFSIYYNHMTAAVIPDLSGIFTPKRLSSIIPDYQSHSPSSEQYGYMLELTKLFSKELNTVLTIDSGAQSSPVYGPNTEGLLSFYSYTVGAYEMCVITKACYETIVESEQ